VLRGARRGIVYSELLASSIRPNDADMERPEDPYGLERFVDAQATAYAKAHAELEAGQKTSHWMWFVFPQLRGLGRSAMAERYGIGSKEEAVAYLGHPILGPRLVDCTKLMLAIEGKTARAILGSPDDLKFRSSMTLFERVAPGETAFARALSKVCAGERDPRTLELLASR
jgi:uncharacterized protein (DUF1810 family)